MVAAALDAVDVAVAAVDVVAVIEEQRMLSSPKKIWQRGKQLHCRNLIPVREIHLSARTKAKAAPRQEYFVAAAI